MLELEFHRRIFLSHAKEDSDIAQNVENLLVKRLGIDVRLDNYFLYAGDQWRAKITDEIKNSELVIILYSRIAEAAEGIQKELSEAKKYGVPVVIGIIRNYWPKDEKSDYQIIDFGKEGKSEEAAWQIARYLLNRSHPFTPTGLAMIYSDKYKAVNFHGETDFLARNYKEIMVFGHSFKKWIGKGANYGLWIEKGNAQVKLYFPSVDAIGMDLLAATHSKGKKIKEIVEKTKQDALDLLKELKDKGKDNKISCYEIQVKPMFSAMAVDPEEEGGFITIDHFLFKIPSEKRPKLDLWRRGSPLYKMYWAVLKELIETSKPLSIAQQNRGTIRD